MNAKNPNLSQLDIAKKQLREIALNVSRGDRGDAARELGISPMTIHRYLTKNDVRELDTALKLIRFFRRRIAARDKDLAA